jgi:DNA-binding CsgD family transcriptional regulator
MRDQLDRDREARRRAEHAELTQRRYGLTPRERDILGLLSQGLPNATIAHRLDLSEKTVKNHLNHIFAKLGVGSRTEAVVVWSGRGSTAADRPAS